LNKVDLIAEASSCRSSTSTDKRTRSWSSCRFRPPTARTSSARDAVPQVPAGRRAALSRDYVTDQPERFFVAEIIREQVLQSTHDELPFSTAVVVDRFEEPSGRDRNLYCTILVERESQKPIVVGRAGR
jgi:GTP-binding protein Era